MPPRKKGTSSKTAKAKITKARVAMSKAALRRQMQLHGEGFFGDVWSGIKKATGFLKDNKIISSVASLIPHPAAQSVGRVAGSLGFGRKGRGQAGRGETVLPGSINAHVRAHNRVLKL